MKTLTKTLSIGIVLFLLLLLSNGLYAQTPMLQDTTNPFLMQRAIEVDPGGGVIYYKMDSIKVGELFTTYFGSTGLGAFDSMVVINNSTDSLLDDEDSPAPDIQHRKYQQHYKGVPVEGAIYIEHHDGLNLWASSGFLVEDLNMSVTPSVNEATALAAAKNHIGFDREFLVSDEQPQDGKLVIMPRTDIDSLDTVITAEDYILAWKFTLATSDSPHYNSEIYVNANNQSIVNELSHIHYDDFVHQQYGWRQDLDTRQDCQWWVCTYYTNANDGTHNIYSTSFYGQNEFQNAQWLFDEMNYNNSTTWNHTYEQVTSSHWSVTKSWDYFKNTTLNRRGISGWGNHVRVYVRGDNPQANSRYEPWGSQDYIIPAFTNGGNTVHAALDLIGHEYTHGINYRQNPIPVQRVSGAIYESFGDIFGFMVERYVQQGYQQDWTIGEDMGTYSGNRNLENPNSSSQPAYYLQSNYWTTQSMSNTVNQNNDWGGIHNNCGVQNKWFHLLCNGPHQTVNGQTRYVNGIGIDKAARIAYYTMTNGVNYTIGNNINFDAVRANSLLAARILYGYCSNEAIQTANAWRAVNVGGFLSCSVFTWYRRLPPSQLTSSINENKKDGIKIKLYPNPTKSTITILLAELNKQELNQKYILTITTLDGKQVYNQTHNTLNNLTIHVADFASGLYIVNITTDNWTRNIKFVKE